MPLVYYDIVRGRSRDQIRALLDSTQAAIVEAFETPGKLAEGSDANTGLRASCPNFQPKNNGPKVRTHFGSGFSGSSGERFFLPRFSFFLPFSSGSSGSSGDSCFSLSSSFLGF